MEFTRGDTHSFRFQRKDANEEVIQSRPDYMWFTVKKNDKTKDVLIQKTLGNGITFDEEFYYHVLIKPEDTRNLGYGDYVYDIQVQTGDYVKTLKVEDLTLTSEVTFDFEE